MQLFELEEWLEVFVWVLGGPGLSAEGIGGVAHAHTVRNLDVLI